MQLEIEPKQLEVKNLNMGGKSEYSKNSISKASSKVKQLKKLSVKESGNAEPLQLKTVSSTSEINSEEKDKMLESSSAANKPVFIEPRIEANLSKAQMVK